MLEPARRWFPTGNVRTISAANFLTGLYQNVLNVVLQRFALLFGGLTVVGSLQALGGRFGLVASLVQPVGGHLADLRGRRALAIRGSLLAMAGMALLVAASRFPGEPWAVPALLLPAYVCTGLSMVSSPALQSAIAEGSDPRRRASAYATTTFFWILPGALLAIPGGLIADRLGYGALFGIAFSFEAVNLVLFARFLVETAPASGANSMSWRARIEQSVHPPRDLRGLFLVVAMDAFAWGLAAGIIYALAAKQFGFSNAELASIAAVWALFFALFLPPTAAFVNRFGPKHSILFSESIGVPIMLGWLFSSRIEHFILVAVLNGLTAATWVPAVQTYIANWTSAERRATVLGSLAAFRGIAAFPAPFLGGVMYDVLGYGAPILANLIGATVVTATIYVVLRDPPAGGVEAPENAQ